MCRKSWREGIWEGLREERKWCNYILIKNGPPWQIPSLPLPLSFLKELFWFCRYWSLYDQLLVPYFVRNWHWVSESLLIIDMHYHLHKEQIIIYSSVCNKAFFSVLENLSLQLIFWVDGHFLFSTRWRPTTKFPSYQLSLCYCCSTRGSSKSRINSKSAVRRARRST